MAVKVNTSNLYKSGIFNRLEVEQKIKSYFLSELGKQTTNEGRRDVSTKIYNTIHRLTNPSFINTLDELGYPVRSK